ncbi:MAG: hypothetical protein JST01_05080 [Cyanobacteria bacterium SZAS TMP-1]|nr:hypothetical protein [Cyanobacteria bacterium SZAS TMP-1]
MRLDSATDFSDIRVQCLGKEYPATQEAWNCLHEVQELRKDWYHNRDHSVDHKRVFNALEEIFVDENVKNNPAHSMLTGFGLTGASDESPRERLDRFKSNLHSLEPSPSPTPWYSELVRDVKHVFGY